MVTKSKIIMLQYLCIWMLLNLKCVCSIYQAFSQEDFEEKLVDFMILSNQSFAIVENESLQRLILLYNPNAKFLSDATVKRRILQRFDLEKEKLRKLVMVRIESKCYLKLSASDFGYIWTTLKFPLEYYFKNFICHWLLDFCKPDTISRNYWAVDWQQLGLSGAHN